MKTLHKPLIAAALASTLILSSVTPAYAVRNDGLYPLSNYWTSAKVMAEYFDWRAFVGWGSVGMTNVMITLGTGPTQGQFTKAMFTDLCGSVAAATLATWKPVSEPTFASHMKAIMKSGGTVAAASACGWISYFAFEHIDHESVKAENAINRSLAPTQVEKVRKDVAALTADHATMESQYHDVDENINEADEWQAMADLYCSGDPTYLVDCINANKMVSAANKRATAALKAFNTAGVKLHADLVKLNKDLVT